MKMYAVTITKMVDEVHLIAANSEDEVNQRVEDGKYDYPIERKDVENSAEISSVVDANKKQRNANRLLDL